MTILTSEHLNELATALSKAQGEFDPALKDSSNPFFKSKYADLPSVWAVSREILCKYGLSLLQFPSSNEGKHCLITRLMHTSGQWMQSSVDLLLTKNDIQGLGSAISYMRRYSMTSILGIVQDDDDGQLAVQKKKEQEKPKENSSIDPAQYAELKKLYDLCDDDCISGLDKWLIENNYHNLAFLPKHEFTRIKNRLLINSEKNTVKYGEDAING